MAPCFSEINSLERCYGGPCRENGDLVFLCQIYFFKNCQKWPLNILDLRYAAASKSQPRPVIINFNVLFGAIGHRWRQKRNDQLRNASELQLRTRVSSEKRQIQNVCDAP